MSKTEYTIADLEAENATLRQRAERAERILAALREPSDAVWKNVDRAYWSSWGGEDMWTVAIRAAVAAAEQEVGA